MERDILLERLERMLAEKEKEVKELRNMLSSKIIEEIKNEVREEMRKEIKRIEAKISELSKSIDALMNEILFIKSEIRSHRKTEIVEITEEKEEERKDDEIIVVD